MRLTIAVKRAQLLREWLYALHGNNERYYYSTLALGIPDGDDYETVLSDLQDGFYDDDIDDILHMYRNRRKCTAKMATTTTAACITILMTVLTRRVCYSR